MSLNQRSSEDNSSTGLLSEVEKRHIETRPRWQSRMSARAHQLIIVVLILTNLTVVGFLLFCHSSALQASVFSKELHETSAEVITKFGWRTNYAHPDSRISDAAWNAIKPSHGAITVTEEYAREHNWPKSMIYPGSNPPKSVYLLEGYHQIHCLTVIRKTLKETLESQPLSFPLKHSMHCFDELRQAIQCNANALPLYSNGGGSNGLGQSHKCNNWDELRAFATEHSACYSDVADDSTFNGTHFAPCKQDLVESTGTEDGLPRITEMHFGDIGP